MTKLEDLHFRRGWDFNGYKELVKEQNPYYTFPGTNFLYSPATMSLADAKELFLKAKNMKADFKSLIEKVIEQMYDVFDIAFGIINKSDSKDGNAYRSFQGQCELLVDSIDKVNTGGRSKWITNAGPGESWHNYGYAVDLGVLQWVDTSGNQYGPDFDKNGNLPKPKKNMDFWLQSLEIKDSSAAHAIWRKRTQLPDVPVYDLEGSEFIHLQMFPKNQSPTSELPILLTTASTMTLGGDLWEYQKADIDKTSYPPPHRLRRYKCNFGESNFYVVGTAHQMWSGDVTGIEVREDQVTVEDKPNEGNWEKTARIQIAIERKKKELAEKFPTIKAHMEKAEELAITHEVSLLNRFPLGQRPSKINDVESYKVGFRAFGSGRSWENGQYTRYHAGCDLYADAGEKIYAIADGVIKRYADFFWQTYVLEIVHDDFIARYAEVQPPRQNHGYTGDIPPESLRKGLPDGLQVGNEVKRGQHIAYVGQLRRLVNNIMENYPYTMLHLEMYKDTSRSPDVDLLTPPDHNPNDQYTEITPKKYKRRSDLLDPTPYLDKMILK